MTYIANDYSLHTLDQTVTWYPENLIYFAACSEFRMAFMLPLVKVRFVT